jgi:hypothetical protein
MSENNTNGLHFIKLEYQLFIGKVCYELGEQKTIKLLKESKDAIKKLKLIQDKINSTDTTEE